MSKVYEALRQKEHEVSTDLESLVGTELELAVDAPLAINHDVAITERVFRAALAAAEEEQPPASETPAPQGALSEPETQAPQLTNEFRHLKLTCGDNSRLVFRTDPHGLAAEQFRFLRRTLEQKFPKGAIVLVTSPAPRDGKTLTALNLAGCLADSGRSTILLEGDVRQPSLRRLLGSESAAPGIEDALAGSVNPPAAIHFVDELSLHVAMVATPPADPSHLVSGSGAKKLAAWAQKRFHWVVIDSPPVLPAADAAQMAALADATLLVVRAQSTPRDLVLRACEVLCDHLSGVVLNEAAVESNPYYG